MRKMRIEIIGSDGGLLWGEERNIAQIHSGKGGKINELMRGSVFRDQSGRRGGNEIPWEEI